MTCWNFSKFQGEFKDVNFERMGDEFVRLNDAMAAIIDGGKLKIADLRARVREAGQRPGGTGTGASR